MRHTLCLALLLAACRAPVKNETGAETGAVTRDEDGDGFATPDDCDDSNPLVSPAATETCNGLDDDCDGATDEGVLDTWYQDQDGDGFGLDGSTAESCEKPEGYVPTGTDCDDTKAAAFPGAPEVCDSIDNDCDGAVDEDLTHPYYPDGDGDGWGDPEMGVQACTEPAGHVDVEGDCDDTDPDVHPEAPEVCNGQDEDCDGLIDEGVLSTWYADADGDGHGGAETLEACAAPEGFTASPGDCDDEDASAWPGATETCDGADNDCDGEIDEAGATGALPWYRDADHDGWGDPGDERTGCAAPSGYTDNPLDCDDAAAAISPAATEMCDGIDNDCDGEVDPAGAWGEASWYPDADGDGWGEITEPVTACDPPSGHVAVSGDCEDGSAAVSPSATEICDGLDNDCDGSTDDASSTDASTWYLDADGDGHGRSTGSLTACTAPDDYVEASDDCDDLRGAVHPGAPETCDGEDQDCDGEVDEDAADRGTFYADADADGFGDPATATLACAAPPGMEVDGSDCDDADPAAFPGNLEVCDGADNDCDGATDEADAADAPTWYADADGDGHGDPEAASLACAAPAGTVPDRTDCDDAEPAAFPGNLEVCDGLDNDCDGATDEAEAVDAPTWYADVDGDGHGDAATATPACACPAGYVADGTDCDDADPTSLPGGAEVCDGTDNDCDGATDEPDAADAPTWHRDADADSFGSPLATARACEAPEGYTGDGSDCDDANPAAFPGHDEVCDGADNDCDGEADEGTATDAPTWYRDADGDGWGDAGTATPACAVPEGFVADDSDCDDGDPTVSPLGTETCDGVDDDCNDVVDDPYAADAPTWYRDGDEDGFGDPLSPRNACEAPEGWIADATDCDDGDPTISPLGTETCNGVDDDCNDVVDDPYAADALTWYADDDGDGFGDPDATTVACDPTSGLTDDATDCDDTDPEVYPGSGVPAVLFDLVACIDGSDALHLRGEEAWWVHYNYTAVGLHSGCGSLTQTYFDDVAWTPSWGSTGYGASSSVYSPLAHPLPAADATLVLSTVEGRGSLTILQNPSASNAWEGAFHINDDPYGGPARYQIQVGYTCD